MVVSMRAPVLGAARYVVQDFPLADQQCNLQFVREERLRANLDSRRDHQIELELLERVVPEVARSFETAADRAAQRAFKDALNGD